MSDRDRVILGAMTPGEILAELARLRAIEKAATKSPEFVAMVRERRAFVAREHDHASGVAEYLRQAGRRSMPYERDEARFRSALAAIDAFLAAIEIEQPEDAS